MQKILFALMLLIMVACSNTPADDAATADAAKETGVHAGANPVTGFAKGAPFVVAGCYQMTLKQDTATLSLEVKDTLVSGSLTYNPYARDKNTGTLKGVLRDSLIIADYTFQSEGTTSVREVIFKIKDTTLVQAFGNIQEQQSKTFFEDRTKLQYMDQNPFVKVACGSDGRQ